MKKNEKKLKQFYRELAAWINAGTPEHQVFKNSWALCFQLTIWLDELPWYKQMYYNPGEIAELQNGLFDYNAFPFGYCDYQEERLLGNHYTSEARLNFIFEQAGVPREI